MHAASAHLRALFNDTGICEGLGPSCSEPVRLFTHSGSLSGVPSYRMWDVFAAAVRFAYTGSLPQQDSAAAVLELWVMAHYLQARVPRRLSTVSV